MPPSLGAPVALERWIEAFASSGSPAVVVQEDGATWIEVATLRMRGFVAFEGLVVEAINFELHDVDPAPAFQLLETVAGSLGWELYQEDDDEE